MTLVFYDAEKDKIIEYAPKIYFDLKEYKDGIFEYIYIHTLVEPKSNNLVFLGVLEAYEKKDLKNEKTK